MHWKDSNVYNSSRAPHGIAEESLWTPFNRAVHFEPSKVAFASKQRVNQRAGQPITKGNIRC